MTEDRKNRIKRMIASAAMMEGIMQSLNQGLASDEAAALKIRANPGFLAGAVDRLLDRMAPCFESMSDEEIAQATAFQESPAGHAMGRCMNIIAQALPTAAAEWMLETQGELARLP